MPHGWVTGDDAFGRHTGFRQELRERGERSVLGVPCNTMMRDLEAPWPAYQGRGRPPKAPWHSVMAWRQSLTADAWTHLTVRDGEKGPVPLKKSRDRVELSEALVILSLAVPRKACTSSAATGLARERERPWDTSGRGQSMSRTVMEGFS